MWRKVTAHHHRVSMAMGLLEGILIAPFFALSHPEWHDLPPLSTLLFFANLLGATNGGASFTATPLPSRPLAVRAGWIVIIVTLMCAIALIW